MPGKYHDIATRAQALTLKAVKCPDAENTKIIGLPRSTINSIYRTARVRSYNPNACQTIFNSYVEDAPKSGALIKATPEVEDAIIAALSKNSTTQGLSYQRLADLIAPKISVRTVHRVLKRRGYRLYKPTTKPGLIAENKLTRLKQCKDYTDQTLEDQKDVIWSDETSVTIGSQRGRRRVQRL